MREAMTKNDPKDTVVGQPSGPGHAIMARLDLDAHGGQEISRERLEMERVPEGKNGGVRLFEGVEV